MEDGEAFLLDDIPEGEARELVKLKLFGNCRGLDMETFFPSVGMEGYQQVREARRFCDPCEVREDCLSFAMRNNIQHGIWGGMATRERQRIRRRRRMEER